MTEQKERVNGWVQKPLCVFCGKPWTDEMVEIEADASEGCETCGHGGGAYGTVSITCSHCNRLVYLKEFDNRH